MKKECIYVTDFKRLSSSEHEVKLKVIIDQPSELFDKLFSNMRDREQFVLKLEEVK